MFPNMNTSDGPPATIHIEESQAPCSAVVPSSPGPSPASVPLDTHDLETQVMPRGEVEQFLSDVMSINTDEAIEARGSLDVDSQAFDEEALLAEERPNRPGRAVDLHDPLGDLVEMQSKMEEMVMVAQSWLLAISNSKWHLPLAQDIETWSVNATIFKSTSESAAGMELEASLEVTTSLTTWMIGANKTCEGLTAGWLKFKEVMNCMSEEAEDGPQS